MSGSSSCGTPLWDSSVRALDERSAQHADMQAVDFEGNRTPSGVWQRNGVLFSWVSLDLPGSITRAVDETALPFVKLRRRCRR
jgi:hypothetical protein